MISTPRSRESRGIEGEVNEGIADHPVNDSDLEDQSSQAYEFVNSTQRLEMENLDTIQPTPYRI